MTTPFLHTPSVPRRILVVEDESIIARDIQDSIGELGYDAVGHALTAEEALAMADQVQPDLVLMDIQLQGAMDGLAVAHQLRLRFNLPVVFLTAFSADDVLERAKLAQPYGYVLKPFTARELKTVLAMAFSKHASDNAMHQMNRQLQALGRRVVEVQEEERRRIAAELHDELGQVLAALGINMQLQLKIGSPEQHGHIAESIALVEGALQQVRRLALGLRPPMLDDLGLAPALIWMAEQTARRSGFVLRCQLAKLNTRMPPVLETVCYRVAQESLTNIVRHAQASEVVITLEMVGDAIELCVQDNGRGFAAAMPMPGQGHTPETLGIFGMKERAMCVGGELNVSSTPGQGTRVRLRCPLLHA